MNHHVITAGMTLTSLCSAVGLVAFCFVGLVATELVLIPQSVRLWAVLIGGAAVAIGAEGGSLFAFVAAFERDGKLRGWDVVGALFSQAATLSTVIFAFRALSGSGSSPAGFVLNTVFVSLDATFNYVALGLHLRNGRALALAEKQAALEYHRQAVAIEKQRADLRNQNAPEVAQLRRHVAELSDALQSANAIIDSFDNATPVTVTTPPLSQNVSSNSDTGGAITDNDDELTESEYVRFRYGEPVTDNDNDTPVTDKKMTLAKWRAIRDALTDKPLTPAALNSWLADNGYATVSERTAYRWLDDGAKRDK